LAGHFAGWGVAAGVDDVVWAAAAIAQERKSTRDARRMFVSFGFRLELIGKKKARVSERTVYLYRAFVMERGGRWASKHSLL
jgi:hypothetical protein